jgi:hypothetical protein
MVAVLQRVAPSPTARPPDAARPGVLALLGGLRAALQALSAEHNGASRNRKGVVKRRLLLGHELLAKIEDQLLYPALLDAEPALEPSVRLARKEIELLRELSTLVARTAAGNREFALSVLDGMAQLHFARVDELLLDPGVQSLPWKQLERQTQALLGRWHQEVVQHGDIEDEDADPVGRPPR